MKPFRFELLRFCTKGNIIVLIVYTIISFVLLEIGIKEYKFRLDEIESYKAYERLKVSQYFNYEQYGGVGFRVTMNPTPETVFFSGASESWEANVDTKEAINIYIPRKGGSYFGRKKIDIAQLIFWFWTIGAMFWGSNSMDGIKKLISSRKLTTIILSRFLVLALFYTISTLSVLIYIQIRIKVSFYMLYYILYLLCLIGFFYFLGVLISFTNSLSKAFVIVSLWIVLVLLLPKLLDIYVKSEAQLLPANEAINYEKLMNKKQFEKKAEKEILSLPPNYRKKKAQEMIKRYAVSVYSNNRHLEKTLFDRLVTLLDQAGYYKIVFPTSYIVNLGDDLGGKGYHSYIEFSEYISDTRDRFFKFYIKKRFFNKREGELENFCKNNENIYNSRTMLSNYYWLAILVLFLKTLVLLLVSVVKLKKSNKECRDYISVNINNLKVGKLNYIQCDQDIQYKIINYFSDMSVIIKKYSKKDIGHDMPINNYVKYLSYILEADENRAFEIINEYQINAELHLHDVDEEKQRWIWAALLLSIESDIYIFIDFLRGSSRTFESELKKVLLKKYRSKRIVYLGSEMFTWIDEGSETNTTGYKSVAIDLEKISLI